MSVILPLSLVFKDGIDNAFVEDEAYSLNVLKQSGLQGKLIMRIF